mmetsp:Transcript_5424/g.16723  ORF Transcript_5424/g.16723 Transcript_5424/m.16723 type:complete len:111 (+) Transcript_5424:776-1108(+)
MSDEDSSDDEIPISVLMAARAADSEAGATWDDAASDDAESDDVDDENDLGARVMVGLEALPHPAREEIVRCLPSEDLVYALPFVSEGTLAALQELRLPVGNHVAGGVVEV